MAELDDLVKRITDNAARSLETKKQSLDQDAIEVARSSLKESKNYEYAVYILKRAILENKEYHRARSELLQYYSDTLKARQLPFRPDLGAVLMRMDLAMTCSTAESRKAVVSDMLDLMCEYSKSEWPKDSAISCEDMAILAALIQDIPEDINWNKPPSTKVSYRIAYDMFRHILYGKGGASRSERLYGLALALNSIDAWSETRPSLKGVLVNMRDRYAADFLAAAQQALPDVWETHAQPAIESYAQALGESVARNDCSAARYSAGCIISAFQDRSGITRRTPAGEGPQAKKPAVANGFSLKRYDPCTVIRYLDSANTTNTSLMLLCLMEVMCSSKTVNAADIQTTAGLILDRIIKSEPLAYTNEPVACIGHIEALRRSYPVVCSMPKCQKGLNEYVTLAIKQYADSANRRLMHQSDYETLLQEIDAVIAETSESLTLAQCGDLIQKVRGRCAFEAEAPKALKRLEELVRQATRIKSAEYALEQWHIVWGLYESSKQKDLLLRARTALIEKANNLYEQDYKMREANLITQMRANGGSPVKINLEPIGKALNTDGSPEDDTIIIRFYPIGLNSRLTNTTGGLEVKVYEKSMKTLVTRLMESQGNEKRSMLKETKNITAGESETVEYIDIEEENNISATAKTTYNTVNTVTRRIAETKDGSVRWEQEQSLLYSQDKPKKSTSQTHTKTVTKKGDRFDRGKVAAVGTFSIAPPLEGSSPYQITFKADRGLPKGDIVVEATLIPFVGRLSVDRVDPEGRIERNAETRKVWGDPVAAIGYGRVDN